MPTIEKEESKLSLPGEMEEKVEYHNPEENNSEVKIPLAPKAGIEVMATRKGFFGSMRKREGDKFIVPKFESLGEWMVCVDPALEKKRVEFFKMKKQKAKK